MEQSSNTYQTVIDKGLTQSDIYCNIIYCQMRDCINFQFQSDHQIWRKSETEQPFLRSNYPFISQIYSS